MHGIIDKRAVYTSEGKLERVIHTARLPDRFTANIDRHEFAYDYNYDITEDDNYYEPKIHNNNDNTTKHNTYKKNRLTLNFSGFSFAIFTISSILLSAS